MESGEGTPLSRDYVPRFIPARKKKRDLKLEGIFNGLGPYIDIANGDDAEDRLFELLSDEEFRREYVSDIIPALKRVRIVQKFLNSQRMRNRRDIKTRLYNSESYEWEMNEEIPDYYSTGNNKPMSLLLIDLDNFKDINDTYGHMQGDMALVYAANAIKSGIRSEKDRAYRWGGDEFAVILKDTDEEAATEVGKRMLNNIRNKPIGLERNDGTVATEHLTFSIGVSTYYPEYAEFSKERVTKEADLALYHVKETGKDGIIHFSDYRARNEEVNNI